MNLTKHRNFPVPVSKSKTKKFYAFLPNFETENLFSKSCSRKIGNYSENRELFGKPGTTSSLHYAFSLSCLPILSFSFSHSL